MTSKLTREIKTEAPDADKAMAKRLRGMANGLDPGPGGTWGHALGVCLELGQRALAEAKALRRELDELKSQVPRYCGVWAAGTVYEAGSLTTFRGSMWHADRETGDRPGDGPNSGWTLSVKHGRDLR